jgi:tetratricopeptide (TPR) repeat protein
MNDSMLTRAEVLIQQKRYSEAENMLIDILATSPNDIHVLSLLAESYLQQDKFDKAEIIINSAIAIDPSEGLLFYLKSRISLSLEKYDDAETNLRDAVKLNPAGADYYALWALVKLIRKQYQAALDLADQALALDAENIQGLNTRSTALLKLNRKEDSFKTIEGALREDPNNSFTHSNYGWNLLEKGDHKKALEHFQESLKNDPSNTHAQSGMVEAIKATNFFYRLFLQYSFWIGNLTSKYQWGVIVGFYFGTQAIKNLAKHNEALRPYLIPLFLLLAVIAFSTWIMQPIGNLFLRLNKYGVHLLDKEEKMSSNFVGISFLIFVVGLISYIISGNDAFLTLTFFGFAMMLPVGSMLQPSKPKHLLIIYTALMSLIGIAAIVVTFANGDIFNGFSLLFIACFTLFQWIANYIIISRNNI